MPKQEGVTKAVESVPTLIPVSNQEDAESVVFPDGYKVTVSTKIICHADGNTYPQEVTIDFSRFTLQRTVKLAMREIMVRYRNTKKPLDPSYFESTPSETLLLTDLLKGRRAGKPKGVSISEIDRITQLLGKGLSAEEIYQQLHQPKPETVETK